MTMAEDEKQLLVVDRERCDSEQKSKYEKEDLLRWNDYGIGCSCQGDLKAAEATFLTRDRNRSVVRRRMGQCGAGAHSGRQHGGAQQVLEERLWIWTANWRSQTTSMLSRSRLRASMTRPSAPAEGLGQVPARSRCSN